MGPVIRYRHNFVHQSEDVSNTTRCSFSPSGVRSVSIFMSLASFSSATFCPSRRCLLCISSLNLVSFRLTGRRTTQSTHRAVYALLQTRHFRNSVAAVVRVGEWEFDGFWFWRLRVWPVDGTALQSEDILSATVQHESLAPGCGVLLQSAMLLKGKTWHMARGGGGGLHCTNVSPRIFSSFLGRQERGVEAAGL